MVLFMTVSKYRYVIGTEQDYDCTELKYYKTGILYMHAGNNNDNNNN